MQLTEQFNTKLDDILLYLGETAIFLTLKTIFQIDNQSQTWLPTENWKLHFKQLSGTTPNKKQLFVSLHHYHIKCYLWNKVPLGPLERVRLQLCMEINWIVKKVAVCLD